MTSRPDDDADARSGGPPEAGVGASDAVPDAAPAHHAASAPDAEPDAAAESAEPAPEPDSPESQSVTIERDEVQVRARLVPRYGRFMVLGAILGLGGGWLWSRLGSTGPLLGVGSATDTSVVVPFLMVVGALAGVVLGAVLAIVLDRLVGRRRRTLTAERTRHRRGDVG